MNNGSHHKTGGMTPSDAFIAGYIIGDVTGIFPRDIEDKKAAAIAEEGIRDFAPTAYDLESLRAVIEEMTARFKNEGGPNAKPIH